jgi:sirohydrochlorin ferrochelatase
VRDPRLSGSTSPLVIAAHGSADPRFNDVVVSIAEQVRARRANLDVRVGFLDHGPPSIDEVVEANCVVVPLLLTSGFHVQADIPSRTASATIAGAVGPDPLLAVALADRLHEARYDNTLPLVLAAAGSSDESARDDARVMGAHLAARLGVEVLTAYLSAGEPKLADVRAEAVSSYLLAPGAFHDLAVASRASVVSRPIGDHPVVAQLVLARYDEARQVPGRTAPA